MRIAAIALGTLCLSAGAGLGYLALPAPLAVAAVQPAKVLPANMQTRPTPLPPMSATEERWLRPKPGLDVRVMGPPRYFLGEGEDRHLELSLSTGDLQGALRVEVSSSEGLDLLNEAQYQFDLNSSRRVTLQVWLLGTAPGEHFLNIVATDASGERRTSAVVVQVGSDAIIAQAKSAGNAQAVAAGEIALPAREVIR